MPSTTKLLIELLTIGSVGSIWVGLFVATKWDWLTKLVAATKDADILGPIAVVVGVALVYQLGIVVNWLAWRLFRCFLEPQRKARFRKHNVDYEEVRPLIWKHATDDILAELKNETSELRICRANCVNFVLIAIALVTYRYDVLWGVAVLSLLIAVMLGIQSWHIHLHHFEKLERIYVAIVLEPNVSNGNGE